MRLNYLRSFALFSSESVFGSFLMPKVLNLQKGRWHIHVCCCLHALFSQPLARNFKGCSSVPGSSAEVFGSENLSFLGAGGERLAAAVDCFMAGLRLLAFGLCAIKLVKCGWWLAQSSAFLLEPFGENDSLCIIQMALQPASFALDGLASLPQGMGWVSFPFLRLPFAALLFWRG